MTIRDPETNFEELWKTFHHRYPFFALRNVDWAMQYATYRPKVTKKTSDDELFDIFSQMLAPLNDGHVELTAKVGGDSTILQSGAQTANSGGIHEPRNQSALQNNL